MKKHLSVPVVLLLAVSLFPAAVSADVLEEVKKKGVLVAGVNEASPPFGFMDRDKREIVGIEPDLAAAIAGKLGVKLKLLPVTSAERIPALLDGKVDIVAATMSRSPDRAKLVDFSLTYFKTVQRILARTGTVANIKDLGGKKVGVIVGSAAEAHLKSEVPAAVIYPFGDYKFAVEALRKGAIDALTGDGVILYGILASLPKDAFEIPMGMALSDESYGLAVRKGNAKFVEFVDATLTEMNRTGEAKKVFEKWLQRRDVAAAPPPSPPAAEAAGGVVIRPTSTDGRFVVLGMSGVFKCDQEVGIFDPQGNFVCTGKVLSIYGDEMYVDASCAPKDSIEVGSPVSCGYPSLDEAKKLILQRQDVLKQVKEEAKKEAEKRQKEIASEYSKEEAERHKYQEQMETTKMQLDYQYNDDQYYWGRWGWGGYWW
jgi:polar amino acid transport system substrate-binding protein